MLSPSPDADAHGDCVSNVAKSDAEAANEHGDESHGAAVSKAAHECDKDSNENDQDKPDATESPEPADSPEATETPDAAESPDPAETPGD